MRKFLTYALSVFAVGVSHLLSTPTLQAASSPWLKTDGAQIRLVSLPTSDGKSIRAGLQIQLDKGWKTYWRTPGASGLPPQVSFSASQNVKDAKILFPSPQLFSDTLGFSAGYKGSVTFPIQVHPLTAGEAITLNARGIVGICADICVPVQFDLSVTESGNSGTDFAIATALNAAEANLPGPSNDNQHVVSAKVEGTGKKALMIETIVPAGGQKPELFVEGPSNWYLSPARLHKTDSNKAYFELDLSDIPPADQPESVELTFVLVVDGRGIEQRLKPSK